VTVDATLAALADPTRRAVVGILSKGPQHPSSLAEELATTRPVISRHLRVLRQAGLVSETVLEKDARLRLYQLRQAPFVELSSWLQEVEGFWTDQLDAFKRHAERSQRSKRKKQA
jgi:DNA-binding transcriptional ArsR family regulator